MYERRLSRLLVLFLLLLGGIGLRVFAVQVLAAGDHLAHLETRVRPSVSLQPRRGEILYADGTPIVRNEPSFSVYVDFAAFDERLLPSDAPLPEAGFARKRKGARATIHACDLCGTRVKRTAAPEACAECGSTTHLRETEAPTRTELALLLHVEEPRLEAALRSAVRDFEENAAHRLHPLLTRVARDAAAAVTLAADRFPGVVVRALGGRHADPVARDVVGTVGPPYAEDMRRLQDERRRLEGKHVYRASEVYRTLIGRRGLEREFDEELRGTPGTANRERDEFGRYTGNLIPDRAVVDGTTLRTTLLPHVQEVAYGLVREAPGRAAAVVMDVRTGAVVALASNSERGFHEAVTMQRPGSVFKLVTALAFLESGGDAEATLRCGMRGRLPSGLRYKCEGLHNDIALDRAFSRSCNYYFMLRAEHAGAEALVDACRRLGLERNDRLHLKGSSAGLEYAPGLGRKWARSDLAHVGIGQGPIELAPLQVATAYARLATGGRKVRPFLLERERPAAAFEVDPVVARHAPHLREIARRVVVSGTGRNVPELREVRAAGKSGTAEVRWKPGDPGDGGLVNNAWFVGYAPYDDPRYVAVVVHLRVLSHGADACGEPVARLLREALR